jgi:hypothetical protein
VTPPAAPLRPARLGVVLVAHRDDARAGLTRALVAEGCRVLHDCEPWPGVAPAVARLTPDVVVVLRRRPADLDPVLDLLGRRPHLAILALGQALTDQDARRLADTGRRGLACLRVDGLPAGELGDVLRRVAGGELILDPGLAVVRPATVQPGRRLPRFPAIASGSGRAARPVSRDRLVRRGAWLVALFVAAVLMLLAAILLIHRHGEPILVHGHGEPTARTASVAAGSSARPRRPYRLTM